MSASGEFRWPPVGIFPWPPSLTEYRRLPHLITILAIVVILVLGIVAISLV